MCLKKKQPYKYKNIFRLLHIPLKIKNEKKRNKTPSIKIIPFAAVSLSHSGRDMPPPSPLPPCTTQTRYSYLLTLLFVAMAYSGGIFAMNGLSFLFFFITYWVDKTMLLRFYRRPPHREDALQRQVIAYKRMNSCRFGFAFEHFTPRTDDRFPLDDLDLFREDRFLICMI